MENYLKPSGQGWGQQKMSISADEKTEEQQKEILQQQFKNNQRRELFQENEKIQEGISKKLKQQSSSQNNREQGYHPAKFLFMQQGRQQVSWGGIQRQRLTTQRSEESQWGQCQEIGEQSSLEQQHGPVLRHHCLKQKSVSTDMTQSSVPEVSLLPVKPTSCNGIQRGTLGKIGRLEVNYLNLNLDKMPNEAYHYDVCITPDRPKKFLREAFEQCRREMFPDIVAAFDGNKNCFTIQRLTAAIDHRVEISDFGNRMREFHIQIKETENVVVDLNSLRTYHKERVSSKPMRALQVLDVVLASNSHAHGIRIGRSFFCKPNKPFDLEEGFEAWTGLFQAAILGEQPFLNVDIAHKSFPRQSTLIEYLRKQNINLQQDLNNDRWALNDIRNFLRGMDIIYEPPKNFGATAKKYKVLDVGDIASRIKFITNDNIELTVADYFQSRGYRLQYPQFNCLQVGSTMHQISLPMEFCSIPEGQVLNRKDGKRQVEKMIRFAATSTNVRKRKIMDLLANFGHNNNPIVRAFGLQIGTNFIEAPMRLLSAPYMEYKNGQTVTASRGTWRMDNLQFLVTSKSPVGHKWAIIYEEKKCRRITFHDLENFKRNVINKSKSFNMSLANQADIMSYHDVTSKLKELATKKYDLVFVILADKGTAYAKVKQNAELVVGILTQCIKEQNVVRSLKDQSVFSNILLKVNAKLNGINHKIAQDREPKIKQLMEYIKNVMYLGADVTHPSPDQREIPSVVGSAASHDPHGACYNCQYRLQRSTVENIEDMESIMSHHLDVYYRYQKCYPSHIIYYRDGVSDGQFLIVQREELRDIKNACKKKGVDAKLTCVIVVKRHHTRFFPLSKPRNERDFNNVEPGTVVDQHITHPNEVQFFMVSHQSIQGTAKPTRYNVIVDEANLHIDLLQMLTYNLCHMFPRCNRAVSYPAPAYLAHLVASRGRVYIEGISRFNNNLAIEYKKRTIRPEFMVRNPMYFV